MVKCLLCHKGLCGLFMRMESDSQFSLKRKKNSQLLKLFFKILAVLGLRCCARAFSGCCTSAQLPFSMWDLSSLTRDQTHVPCIGRYILDHWLSREVSTQFSQLLISLCYLIGFPSLAISQSSSLSTLWFTLNLFLNPV